MGSTVNSWSVRSESAGDRWEAMGSTVNLWSVRSSLPASDGKQYQQVMPERQIVSLPASDGKQCVLKIK
jgi:hypothetical protein